MMPLPVASTSYAKVQSKFIDGTGSKAFNLKMKDSYM